MAILNIGQTDIDSDQIDTWIDGYNQFLTQWTSNSGKIAINKLGLVSGGFVLADPYTSYTPPTTGTSEGQLLTIRGCLRAYIDTGIQAWLDRATLLTNALLTYYYPTATIPSTPNPLWIPHWLVNVNAPFTARQFFLNQQITFSKGQAIFTEDQLIRVYTARALDATLDDTTSPASPITGTEYPIASIDYDWANGKATIKLEDSTFSGDALITYSTSTGETVEVGDKCEAYPVWRHLDDGEIACAADTLPWALDVYNLWYKITGDSKWKNAADSTEASIAAEYQVDNVVYWIKPGKIGETVLENGVTSYSERNPKEIYTNDSSGFINIVYAKSNGEALMGTWVGNGIAFTSDNYLELKLGSDSAAKVFMYLDEEQAYDVDKRWTAQMILNGAGLDEADMQTIDLRPSDFYKSSSIMWGKGYIDVGDGTAVASTNSSVTATDTIATVSNKSMQFKDIVLKRGMEGATEAQYLGWAQYIMIAGTDALLPFDISYHTQNNIYLVINDKNGNRWQYQLPKTASDGSFKTVHLTANMFSTTTSATLADLESGNYQSIFVDAIDTTSTIDIDYIGSMVTMPETAGYSEVSFGYNQEAALTVELAYIKPAPSNSPIPYVPYIAPFDMHLVDGKLSDLRGAPYTGYQAPWIFQEMQDMITNFAGDSSESLQDNLSFLEAAQDAYEDATGVRGFFAPVYWWNYRDDYDGHTPNTFGMSGPWGDVWGGFQYRTISDVARVLKNNPSNSDARDILADFYSAVNSVWQDDLSNFPNDFHVDDSTVETNEDDSNSFDTIKPTNNQNDPHMVALLLRSLAYADNASSIFTTAEQQIMINLVNKCLEYLQNTYVAISDSPFSTYDVEGTFSPDPADDTWYEYWGGDIISALTVFENQLASVANNADNESQKCGYVYIESAQSGDVKAFALINNSEYFGLQEGSPSIVTIDGACVNPSWRIIQNGNTIFTDAFELTLADNQKLIVSSYPGNQYARVYNPDGTYVDVSQYQDLTKTNFVLIPEGNSTIEFTISGDATPSVTFREGRLLV